MGARGPAPTPKKILKMRGSWRAEIAGDPKLKTEAPKPPTWLSKEARAEWNRVVPALASAGLLCKIDRAALAIMCKSWADYIDASKRIKKEGDTYLMPHGQLCVNPLVGIRKQAFADWVKLASMFGLTPSSRARINVVGEPEKPEKEEKGKGRFFA